MGREGKKVCSTSTGVDDLGPEENPSVWEGWSSHGFLNSPAGRRSGSLLITGSQKAAASFWKEQMKLGTLSALPFPSQLGILGRQSTIRNWSFPSTRYVARVSVFFFFNGKVLILFLKENIMTSCLCTEALEISCVHNPSSAIY